VSGTGGSSKVFDLTLPLDQVAQAYAAMDERRSIKTRLTP
jgi:threonine dehydrogenase-like Zn-dependent dehydrogenase